jgi:hypothetical protein
VDVSRRGRRRGGRRRSVGVLDEDVTGAGGLVVALECLSREAVVKTLSANGCAMHNINVVTRAAPIAPGDVAFLVVRHIDASLSSNSHTVPLVEALVTHQGAMDADDGTVPTRVTHVVVAGWLVVVGRGWCSPHGCPRIFLGIGGRRK